MNALRQPVRLVFRRTYATASAPFVPHASLQDMEGGWRNVKAKPDSPTFYTGRAGYYDQVTTLEGAIRHSSSALRTLQLLPLPDFARAKLPPLQPVWMTKDDMSSVFESRLTTSRYRRVTTLLNQLNDHRRIAETAGVGQLHHAISQILQIFERQNKAAVLARGKRKPVQFDEYGRTYTVGRRKESAARVWIIPVQVPTAPATSSETSSEPADAPSVEASSAPTDAPAPPVDEQTFASILGITEDAASREPAVPVTTTTILVNNQPLSTYFPLPADRERITRPFVLTGLLGAYNVFSIVRGGGTSGQSGAIMHGIAKGLAAHAPDVQTILRKSKLLRRDPRMVERKKTGLAKSRKAYAWVKR